MLVPRLYRGSPSRILSVVRLRLPASLERLISRKLPAQALSVFLCIGGAALVDRRIDTFGMASGE